MPDTCPEYMCPYCAQPFLWPEALIRHIHSRSCKTDTLNNVSNVCCSGPCRMNATSESYCQEHINNPYQGK